MGMSITCKILEQHLAEGELTPGSEIAIRIDQTLTQDATGTMAYLQFEAMNVPKVKTELSVSYVDHNTIQVGFENADDHRYLQSVAAKYGTRYSRAGNGICHQVHLERFGRPGKTLLGSDSHTPTAGGVGMIGIGAGGLDVAVAMAGGPFHLACPRVIRINLEGKLPLWISAKDVVLKVLEIFGVRGNVGRVFEYGGEGVKTLSVPERATITNMGAECGVTTSVFPSDEVTREFLEAQGRAEHWSRLEADENAEYEKTVTISLSELEPLASCPHSPGNVKPVSKLAGTPVQQVCIGSCTNGSYRDIMTIAKVLEGRTVHPDVSLVVVPGSRQVLRMVEDAGALKSLLASGARIDECACGFCIGNSRSPGTDAVSLRTSNRNFLGRSGTKSAQVYLVSPETAIASAISGVITDPRTLAVEYPDIPVPQKFIADDSMILPPAEDPSTIEISRGPNIGDPPQSEPMPESIRAKVGIKVGDNVTTDHIIPAGARMKYRSNVPKYSEFVFEMVDPAFHERAKAARQEGYCSVIVAGLSYGQGSSREHAAICPMYLGVRAVLAKSFERIHADNLVNFGIAPLTFGDESDYDAINQGDELEMPDIRKKLSEGKPVEVVVKASGRSFLVNCNLSPRRREILLAGGTLAYMSGR